MKVKFRTEWSVATIRGNQKVARQCLIAAAHWKDEQTEHKEIIEETPLYQLQKHRGEKVATGAEGLAKVKILPNTDRHFQIGSSMKEGDKIKVLLFLKSGMPKRPVPNAEDRTAGRCYIWTPENELLGRLSGVSSNRPGTWRLGKDGIHLPGRQLPLHRDAIWA